MLTDLGLITQLSLNTVPPFHGPPSETILKKISLQRLGTNGQGVKVPFPSPPEVLQFLRLFRLVVQLIAGFPGSEFGFCLLTHCMKASLSTDGILHLISGALPTLAISLQAPTAINIACTHGQPRCTTLSLGHTDYSGFDRENWERRSCLAHRESCRQILSEVME